MEVAELNNLRRRVRTLWNRPGDRLTALIHLSDEDGDRAAVGQAFQTLCSELGIRHVRLDLADGLTDAHRETISRTSKHPRMIVLTRFEGIQKDLAGNFQDLLCEGSARTLPVIVGFAPADVVESVHAAWGDLKRMEEERAARIERLRAAGFDEAGEPLSTSTPTTAAPTDDVPFV